MHPFTAALHTIHVIDAISAKIGKLASMLAMFMALLIGLIVISRGLLSSGSIAAQEAVTYMHAALFMLSMAFTLQADAHVRVDIFYRRFSHHRKAWCNTVGDIVLLLPYSVFVMLVSWNYAATSWHIGESSSDSGGLAAVFVLKSLIPLAGALIAFQCFANILRNLLTLTYDQTHKRHQAPNGIQKQEQS